MIDRFSLRQAGARRLPAAFLRVVSAQREHSSRSSPASDSLAQLLTGLERRSAGQLGLQAIRRDQRGSPVLELALVTPVLFTILFAIVAFGITLNNYVELANGVAVGARILSISRGSATPYTATANAVTASAANLNATTLGANLTIAVNGTACSTDATCQTALNNAVGQPATVSASYPCTLGLVGLQSICNLASKSTHIVE